MVAINAPSGRAQGRKGGSNGQIVLALCRIDWRWRIPLHFVRGSYYSTGCRVLAASGKGEKISSGWAGCAGRVCCPSVHAPVGGI